MGDLLAIAMLHKQSPYLILSSDASKKNKKKKERLLAFAGPFDLVMALTNTDPGQASELMKAILPKRAVVSAKKTNGKKIRGALSVRRRDIMPIVVHAHVSDRKSGAEAIFSVLQDGEPGAMAVHAMTDTLRKRDSLDGDITSAEVLKQFDPSQSRRSVVRLVSEQEVLDDLLAANVIPDAAQELVRSSNSAETPSQPDASQWKGCGYQPLHAVGGLKTLMDVLGGAAAGVKDAVQAKNEQKGPNQHARDVVSQQLMKLGGKTLVSVLDEKKVDMVDEKNGVEKKDVVESLVLPKGVTKGKAASDGNCLFDSLSQVIKGVKQLNEKSKLNAKSVRSAAVGRLREVLHDGMLSLLGAETLTTRKGTKTVADLKQYKDVMKKDGTWGGEPEVAAAALAYDVTVVVFASDLRKPVVHNYDAKAKEKKDIVAVCLEGDHYSPCFATQDVLENVIQSAQ